MQGQEHTPKVFHPLILSFVDLRASVSLVFSFLPERERKLAVGDGGWFLVVRKEYHSVSKLDLKTNPPEFTVNGSFQPSS